MSATPVSLRLYRGVMGLSGPVLNILLKRRTARGKEVAERLSERRGIAARPRPSGPLIWIHAASVGEANSVLTLIERLLADDRRRHVLLTTGTQTSARLMTERLPGPGAFHHFIPLDHPRWVERFLDHWQPHCALFVESELWPNLLLAAEARKIPLVLLNARLSERSFERWAKAPRTARRLLSCFSLCLAQDAETARRLVTLGAPHVEELGNLKAAAAPLPADANALCALTEALKDRPRFVAASTHRGEEALIARCHRELKAKHKNFLTIIAPRHPERGNEIATTLRLDGFKVAVRSCGDAIAPETDIYLADTVGELGLFFRTARVVFMGGSLIPHGGQNPLEPARLGAQVLHGPYIANHAEAYRKLNEAGLAFKIEAPDELAPVVERLLLSGDPPPPAPPASDADAVIARIADALGPFLPPPAPSHARA